MKVNEGTPHCAGVTEDFAFASSDLAAAGPTGSSSAGLEASTAVQLSSSSSNESDDTFETDELEFVLDTTKQHVDRVDDFSQTSRALHHLCRSESVECARRSSLRTRSSSTSLSLSPSHCCSDSDCDNLWCDASNSKRVKHSADADSEDSPLGMGCLLTRVKPQSPPDTGPRKTSNGTSSSADDEDDSDEGRQPTKKDVGLKSISNADLLTVQRQTSPDVTRNLEDRWMRSHFDIRHFEEQTVGGEHSLRRKSVSRTTYISDEIDHPSLAQSHENAKRLSILHFNDVYEVSERRVEPVGGAARFASAIEEQVARVLQETGEKPLIIFAGDCLNPSTLSCATQGEHMIKVMNLLKVDVAVFGNHEFDFGAEHAVKCISKMDSTWLLSNVTDNLTKRNLVEGETMKMVEHNGIKIGFVGLVEEEWLDTLTTVDKSNLNYTDYVERGRQIASELRRQGADFVIALTHMRWPNDIRLARKVTDIDLVLGGHDHEYGVKKVDECLIIKSGSDFRNFSSIDAFIREDGCVDVKLARFDVTKVFTPQPEMAKLVETYMSALEKSLDKKIGEIQSDLDGTFTKVRSQETRLGNFVADVMASVTHAEVVLINSGTFRSDDVHPRGDFRLNDLMKILPISDTVITIEVTGQQLLDALENGVSKWPKLEGRFPQVSGVCFGFDANKPGGRRVIRETVRVGSTPLQLDRVYTLATKAYVARGKDGYQCLKACQIRTDPDSSPLLSTVVRNHIKNVYKLMEFEKHKGCKIEVSHDGHTLSSDSDEDPLQAFAGRTEADEVAPLTMIQKSMEGVVDLPNTVNSKPIPPSGQIHHTPNFIGFSPSASAEATDDIGQKVAQLRRRILEKSEVDLYLLNERRDNPHELRWQVLPLLEARIFQCTKYDLS